VSDIGTITATLTLKDLLSKAAPGAVESMESIEEAGESLAQTMESDVGPAVDKAANELGKDLPNATGKARDEFGRFIPKGKELGDTLGKKLPKDVDAAESKLKELINTIAKAGKAAQEMGRKISDVGKDMTAKITAPIAAIGVGSITLATNLNESIANVSALLSGTDAEVDKITADMKGRIRSLAVDVGKSTGDISSGFYEVVSSLGYSEDSFEQLRISAVAANAGLSTTQEAFSFLSAVTKTYGDTSAEAFRKAADLGFQAVNLGQTTFPELSAQIGSVAPLAQMAGVSMEEMFAIIATATGVTGNTARVTTQMAAAISGLINPSDQMSAVFKKLKVSSGEMLIEQRGLAGALQAVAEYAEATGTPLAKLLGREEAVIVTAALAGAQQQKFADTMVSMGEVSQNVGKVLEDANRRQTQGINKAGFAWRQLKVEAQVAMEKLGDELIPIVLRAGESLRPMWEGIQTTIDKFGKLPPSLQTSIVTLVALVAAAGPVVYIAGQIVIAWGAIAAALPAIGGAIGSVVAVLSGPAGWAVAAVALLLAWKPVREFLVDLAGIITRIFKGAVSAAIEVSSLWWKSTEDLRAPFIKIGAVITSLVRGGFKSYIDTANKIISLLSKWRKETDYARKFTFEFARVIRADLWAVLGKIVSAVQWVIDKYISYASWVAELIVKTKDLVISFLDWSGILPAVRIAIGFVIGVLKTLWEWLVKTKEKLFEWVESIGGWISVIAIVNPGLAAAVALLNRWVEKTKAGVKATEDAATATKKLGQEQAKQVVAGTKPDDDKKKKSPGGPAALTEEQTKALRATQDRIDAMARETAQTLSLLSALKLSPAAYDSERKAQELSNIVLAERDRLQEQGLSLSAQMEAALKREAGALFDAKALTDQYNEAVSRILEIRQNISSIVIPELNFEVNDESTKNWSNSLTQLGFEISNLRVNLVSLPKDSTEYETTLKVLADAEARYQKGLKQLPEILDQRNTARTRETRSQLDVAKSVERSIDNEISVLKKGSAAWDGYLKDLDATGRAKQILGVFSLPRPSASDAKALDEWKKLFSQYRQQLGDLTAKISLSIDAEEAANLKESLKTPYQIFQDYAARVNQLLDQDLLSEEQAQKLISRANEVSAAIQDSISSAADSINQSLSDAVVQAAFEGEDAWEAMSASFISIAKNLVGEWLQIWVKAIADWLKRWLAAQATAKAAQAALGTGGGGGGIDGAGIGSNIAGANWTSSTTSTAGMSSTAMGVAGVAAIFAVVYLGVKQWIETSKEHIANVTFQLRKDAEASVSNVHGNTKRLKGLIKSVQDAGTMVNDFLAALGGELASMSASVTLGRTGQGKGTKFFVELESGLKNWFNKYEDAVQFALLEAIKSAKVTGFTPLMEQGLANIDTSNMSLEGLGEFLGQLREISQLNWSETARQVAGTITNLLGMMDALREVKVVTPEVLESLSSLGASIVNTFQSWQDKLTGRVKSPKEQLTALQNEGKLYEAERKLQIARLNMRKNDLLFERDYLTKHAQIGTAGHNIDRGIIGIRRIFLADRAEQIKTEMTLEQQRLEFIDAELAALDEIIAQLGTMTLDIGSIKLPSTGGVGSALDGVRDFIENTKWELATRGMSEYAAAMAEIGRRYDEQLKQAGNDAKLRAELIALKEKELKLLEKEKIAAVVDSFQDFLGLLDPFEAIKDSAADLIAAINDSPLGDARKARMIARVLGEMERKLDQLAKESAASLFGSLASDLEKYGVAEKTASELRRNMAILEHTIKLANYKAELAILKAQGRIAPEMLKVAEDAIKVLEGIDPTKLIPGAANDNEFGPGRTGRQTPQEKMEAAAKALEDQLSKVRDKLKKYLDAGLDPLQARLNEINLDFVDIRKWLGNTPDIIKAYNDAIRRATEETYSSLTDFYKAFTEGPAANLTTEQQFQGSTNRINELISSVAGGNTSMIDDLSQEAERYMEVIGQMFGTSTQEGASRQQEMLSRIRQVLQGAGIELPSSALGFAMDANSPARQQEAKTDQMIEATEDVADVIDIRAGEQKKLLETAVVRLERIIELLESTGDGNIRQRISYGTSG
jgi:TP901 family phage tail tape measure protein